MKVVGVLSRNLSRARTQDLRIRVSLCLETICGRWRHTSPLSLTLLSFVASSREILYAARAEYEAGDGEELLTGGCRVSTERGAACFVISNRFAVTDCNFVSLDNPALTDLIKADGKVALREVKDAQAVPADLGKPKVRPPGLARHLPKITVSHMCVTVNYRPSKQPICKLLWDCPAEVSYPALLRSARYARQL